MFSLVPPSFLLIRPLTCWSVPFPVVNLLTWVSGPVLDNMTGPLVCPSVLVMCPVSVVFGPFPCSVSLSRSVAPLLVPHMVITVCRGWATMLWACLVVRLMVHVFAVLVVTEVSVASLTVARFTALVTLAWLMLVRVVPDIATAAVWFSWLCRLAL